MKKQPSVVSSGEPAIIKTRKTFWARDIVLNIGLREGFIRAGIALLLPFLLMMLPPVAIWPIAVSAAFLFATGLGHF